MRIATQSRFAIVALLDLAIHSKDEYPVSLMSIAKRQNISLSYIEQLFARLRAEDLVVSYRGPGGGYLLAKPASQISVRQIVSAVDKGKQAGRVDRHAMAQGLWLDLEEQIMSYLDGVYLSHLIEQAGQKNQPSDAQAVTSAPVSRKESPVEAINTVQMVKTTTVKGVGLANSVFDWGRYLSTKKSGKGMVPG